MATLTLVIDDGILGDFYTSVGANPVAEWTQEEKDLWLRVNFLEPYLYKSLIEGGRYARKQIAESAILEEYLRLEKIMDDKLAEITAKAQQELPGNLKGEVVEPLTAAEKLP